MSFREVCRDDELWVGELKPAVVAGVAVILVRTDAGVFVYRDRCPHLGVPLSQGKLEGCALTCAAHHFQYDVHSGRGINPRGLALIAYPVLRNAGIISVDVESRLASGTEGEGSCGR
ncbi:MAG TPA: Rieske 2Fe-2S domain-containing protein [Polyangiaceae bacterium]|nr:Rieske 2Fe-2S domain-containing protein [Polyangiaceae bacterium]